MAVSSDGKDLASNPLIFGPDKATSFAVIRGSFSAPNVEDIIAAKPELAIGNVRTHSKIRDAIASVAPMYLIATAAYPDTFRQLTDLGKLTGREAQAAAAIQRSRAVRQRRQARRQGGEQPGLPAAEGREEPPPPDHRRNVSRDRAGHPGYGDLPRPGRAAALPQRLP